jgi:hypothetical protein
MKNVVFLNVMLCDFRENIRFEQGDKNQGPRNNVSSN